MADKKQHIKDFKKFLEKELRPAAAELKTITKANSRKHLQRLIYTNLLDRFDYSVDKTLLLMIEDEELQEFLLKEHNHPINESEILKMMISSTSPRDLALDRLKDTLRKTVLRNRHSWKLGKLLELCKVDKKEWSKPRVNPSTGHILDSYTQSNKKIPANIQGYADWLYSRRNAIVHGGGGSSLLDGDIKQLKKIYGCEAAKDVRIKLTSVEIAAVFYSDLLDKHLLK